MEKQSDTAKFLPGKNRAETKALKATGCTERHGGVGGCLPPYLIIQ